VERNRLQRQLREIARREWLPGAWEERRETDLLLRARPAAYGAEFGQLREAVLRALVESGRIAP
jgi:RNase P protein component